MKKLYFIEIVLALLLLPLPSFADGNNKPEPSRYVSPDDLSQAMKDAEAEYDLQIKNEPKLPEVNTTAQKLTPLLNKLLNAKEENKTILEDLSEQVDILRNKAIIEKSTLLATQSPRKARLKGSRTVFDYRDGAIYEITVGYNYMVDIQLKKGESLTSVPQAADTLNWELSTMKSGTGAGEITHILLTPREFDIATNLIITTDSHTYHLSIKTGEYHMPSVSWNYSEDNDAKMMAALKKEAVQETTIRPDDLRFTYEIDGDDYDWKPVRIFDDGQKTFIQMPKNVRVSESPVLFLVEDNSDPIVVNYRVKGDYYIVDRLFDKAELRVGHDKKVTIQLDDGKNFFERIFS